MKMKQADPSRREAQTLGRMPLHRLFLLAPQVRDLVEEFLFRDEAFLVEQFDQRLNFPHVGDGQFFDGHEVGGVE